MKKVLNKIQLRMTQAARRSKRSPSEIKLVAVAKKQPDEKILEVFHGGQRDFGENYAQELLSHFSLLTQEPSIRWHFIGHLQRNKVRQILDKISLIHSLDSLDLAKEIDRRAGLISKTQPVLIEVNLGGEETKTGIHPSAINHLVEQLKPLPHLDLQGLMTIPPYRPEPEEARPFFKKLREIRNAINGQKLYKHPILELSMGMTHDFEVAIEEGATIVRIGTGIFGER